MFKETTLTCVSALFGLALASSTPSLAHQQKPKFTRIPAAARIVDTGPFVKVCTGSGEAEVCKPAYTRAKTRTSSPRFSKIKSGKTSFKISNRYWEQCDATGCYYVYMNSGQ